MALSGVKLLALKPAARPYKVSDGDGLHVLVPPTGSRLWRLAYRFGGKQKVLSFGSYPAVSLKEAREKTEAARRLIRDGIDPMAASRPTPAPIPAAPAANTSTFAHIARDWHRRNLARWTPHHAADVLAGLEKEIFPSLGHLDPTTITPPMLLATLRQVEARSADIAQRLRQRCDADRKSVV